jgi:phosphoesterase RecJ-like protein
MVDTANPQRIGKIYNDHAAFLENHPLVIVDHHVTNTGLGTVNLIDSDAASCAELLYALFAAMEAPVTPEAATCLLMGLTTDTQSFQTSSTRAQSLRVAADLMEHGANNYAIVQQVYYSTAYSTAHLLGLSLSKLQHDDGLIWTHISQEMADTTGADDAAYDDVVAVMQRIEGMKIVVLFKERSEGVKISLRSKPGVDVSELAKIWGGGGHAQAAGATLNMDLAAAEREVLSRLRTYLAK